MGLVLTTTKLSTVCDSSLNKESGTDSHRMWYLRLFKNTIGSKEVYDALADGKAVSKVETLIQWRNHDIIRGSKSSGTDRQKFGDTRQKFGDTTPVGFCVFGVFNTKNTKSDRGVSPTFCRVSPNFWTFSPNCCPSVIKIRIFQFKRSWTRNFKFVKFGKLICCVNKFCCINLQGRQKSWPRRTKVRTFQKTCFLDNSGREHLFSVFDNVRTFAAPCTTKYC